MKPNSTESISKSVSLIAVFALLLCQFAAPNAMAVISSSYSATSGAGNLWSTSGSWSAGIPTSAGDTATFNANLSALTTVTIDTTPRTVGILNVGDSTTAFFAYTLAASGGASLTFDNSGSGAQLNKTGTSTAADVISTPITLADNLSDRLRIHFG